MLSGASLKLEYGPPIKIRHLRNVVISCFQVDIDEFPAQLRFPCGSEWNRGEFPGENTRFYWPEMENTVVDAA